MDKYNILYSKYSILYFWLKSIYPKFISCTNILSMSYFCNCCICTFRDSPDFTRDNKVEDVILHLIGQIIYLITWVHHNAQIDKWNEQLQQIFTGFPCLTMKDGRYTHYSPSLCCHFKQWKLSKTQQIWSLILYFIDSALTYYITRHEINILVS